MNIIIIFHRILLDPTEVLNSHLLNVLNGKAVKRVSAARKMLTNI